MLAERYKGSYNDNMNTHIYIENVGNLPVLISKGRKIRNVSQFSIYDKLVVIDSRRKD